MLSQKLELGILEDRANSESSNDEDDVTGRDQRAQEKILRVNEIERGRQAENNIIRVNSKPQKNIISRSNISETSEQTEKHQEQQFQQQIQIQKQPKRMKNYMDKVDIILDVLSKDIELQAIEIEDLKTPIDDKVRQIMSQIYQVFSQVFQQNLRTQVDIDVSYPLGTYKAIVKMEFVKEYQNQDLNFNEQQLIYREYSRPNFNSVCGVAFLYVFQEIAKRLLGYQKLPKLLELFIMFTEYLIKGSKSQKKDYSVFKAGQKNQTYNDDGEKDQQKIIFNRPLKSQQKNLKNKGNNDEYLRLLQKYQKVEQ